MCNLGALALSIICVLLSFIPSAFAAWIIPISILLGGVHLFVVGMVTFSGVSSDSARIIHAIGMIASWLFGIGMYWLALCNGCGAFGQYCS
jgi:hypothetical protein